MQKINDTLDDVSSLPFVTCISLLFSLAYTAWVQANDDLISHGKSSTLGKRSRMSKSPEDHVSSVHGEEHVTASVGSNENLDQLDEDLLRSHESRSTGYVGQNSEIRWLSSVQRQTEHTGADPMKQPYGPPGEGQNAINARSDALHERRDNARAYSRQGSMRHITESTFYLDHESLDMDTIVEPDADPEPDVAERLFDCYYQTVHPSYPLVSQSLHDLQHETSTDPYSYVQGARRFQRRIPQVSEITQAEECLHDTPKDTSPDKPALRHRSKILPSRWSYMGRRGAGSSGIYDQGITSAQSKGHYHDYIRARHSNGSCGKFSPAIALN
jgi:hypothetical protein